MHSTLMTKLHQRIQLHLNVRLILFFLYCKKFRNQYISINKEKVDFSLNISNKLTLLRASRVNAITQARQQSVVNFAVKIPRKETGVPKRKR